MFVALVIRREFVEDPERSFSSARHDGSVNAFVDLDKDSAVAKAISNRREYDPAGRRYAVLIGELTGKVEIPVRYKVIKL